MESFEIFGVFKFEKIYGCLTYICKRVGGVIVYGLKMKSMLTNQDKDMYEKISICEIPKPWACDSITVYIVRDTLDGVDCHAYFACYGICRLLGWSRDWVMKRNVLTWEKARQVNRLQVIELGNIFACLKTFATTTKKDNIKSLLFKQKLTVWKNLDVVVNAMNSLVAAIKTAMKEHVKTSTWVLRTIYNHQSQDSDQMYIDVDNSNNNAEMGSRETPSQNASPEELSICLEEVIPITRRQQCVIEPEFDLRQELELKHGSVLNLNTKHPVWFDAFFSKLEERENAFFSKIKEEVLSDKAVYAYIKSDEFQKRKREIDNREFEKAIEKAEVSARAYKKKRQEAVKSFYDAQQEKIKAAVTMLSE